MKPITPARRLTDAILAERDPVELGFANVYRGVEVGEAVAAAGGAPRGGPYRAGPQRGRAALTPVIVREYLEENWQEGEQIFAGVARSRERLTGTPAPRLLHVLGGGAASGPRATVEELVAGTPLDALLRVLRVAGQPMPVPLALAIAEGLLPLYLAAEVHRVQLRVSPAEVWIEPSGRVRVIPEYLDEESRQAVGAAVMLLSAGIAYAAPEQITGSEGDLRAPMFGLGVMLYEMIAGAHPAGAPGVSMFDILHCLARQDIRPLREHRADLHPSVAALVHRCLSRVPAGRFDGFHELSLALRGVAALFPAAGAIELAALVDQALPAHASRLLPPIALPERWESLPSAGYHAVPLPALPAFSPATEARRSDATLDPEALYPGRDGRPMLAVSASLLVDARPVTRAELERYLLTTGAPRPPHLLPLSPAVDEEPSGHIRIDVANAYARWAGKRLPTEAEWELAVAQLGADRLGVGELWEWTTTSHERAGWVVRGGRWRDQSMVAGSAENRSSAVAEAGDLGFRCVLDRPGAPG